MTVLGIDMSNDNIQALRAQERKYIPVVLTKEEVIKIIDNSTGIYNLVIFLMYGYGLRMSEVLNLRVKDIDFGLNKVYVWDSKSLKDKTIPLPLKKRLKGEVESVEKFTNKIYLMDMVVCICHLLMKENIQIQNLKPSGNLYFQ